MPSCGLCGTFILFGGSTHGDLRFCNDTCLGNYLNGGHAIQHLIPADQVWHLTQELHQGNCPECNGPGPVDVHDGHQVWSFLVMTQWRTVSKVCCKSCARKHQLTSLGISAVAGWWGFPWGLLMTPVQVVRNIAAMLGGIGTGQPSTQLQQIARSMIASRIAQNSQLLQSPTDVTATTRTQNSIPYTNNQNKNSQNPYDYQ